MILYLRGQQLAETLGWQPAHPAYGAWGMGGPLRRPPEPGHLDISMTRHVLEGLQAAGVAADDDVFSRAALFLRRCQNPDGGFFFSTVVVDANKAGPSGEGFRSYGTATADGVLSLLAMGVPPPDLRVKRAVAWMTAHHRTDGVPGFPGNTTENWGEGMLYYYLAGSARVFHRLAILEAPAGRDWRKGMAEELLGRQRPGGEWVNASFLMKEDDPLIATRFALSALLDTL
jgi:squalene-hopene/tetraprenyl-beta-curcumene cyclase